jgi:hypothetical protein
MSFEQSEKQAKACSKYFQRKRPTRPPREETHRYYGPVAKRYEEAESDGD